MSGAPALAVGRLVLRAAGDGTGARRRALARLEAAAPPPPGPPAEVLIVRRMADPAPGRLGRAGGGPVWAAALGAGLAAARAAAARPARGEAAGGAPAVRFADEAELRACLAEALTGGGRAPWWAREVLRRGPPRAGPAAALAPRPDLLPAIAELLIARGSAARVLAGLAPGEPEALAAALGAPPAGRGADGPSPDTGLERAAAGGAAGAGAGPHRTTDAAPGGAMRAASEAPLSALAALDGPRARLLALAWTKRRRPALAGAALCAAAEALRAAAAPAAAPRDLHAPRDAATPPPAAADGAPRFGADAPRAAPDAHPATPARRPGTSRADPAAPPPEPARRPPAPDFAPSDPRAETAEAPAPSPGPSPDPSPAAPAPDPAAGPEDVPTALGGVLFLVNLREGPIPRRAPALAAALAAAERPGEGPWPALERLARALLAPREAEAADPIWPLLAALDARPPEAPETPGPADLSAARAARDWIAAAGWGPDGPPEAAAPADLLRAPARLRISPVHIDALFPAAAARLPARRAGLDLDPGWLPRFGRVIAFRFRD